MPFQNEILSTTNLGHLKITKLVPQVLNRVHTDNRSDEEPDPFHTANTTNGDTSENQPGEPLGAKRLLLQVVEARPAEHSREGEEQKHGIEKNETTDGSVGVFYDPDISITSEAVVQSSCSDIPHNTINVTNQVAIFDRRSSFAV